MNEELKIIISADTTSLDNGAKKAKDSVDNFGKTAEKVQKSTANAGFALSNLGRVASDLPFGFIAIQNNLSPLLESFQGLKKESGSTGGALKALGGSLLGAGGLGFAFAAIPAIITSVIQKYGSLGNALDAFTTKNQAAFDAQQTFNAELGKAQGGVGAEITNIDILVKRLTNLGEPYKKRQEAYELLKKIQPDILDGLSKENVLSGNATTLLLANATARKEMILLKAKESAISKVLDDTTSKLLDAENKKAANDKKMILLEAEKLDYQDQLNKGNKSAAEFVDNTARAIYKLYGQNEVLKLSIKELTGVNDDYSNQLSPIIDKIAEQNKKTLDIADANKKATATADEQARANAKSTEESLKKTKALKEEKLRTDELLTSLQKQGTLAPQANYERIMPTAGALAGEVKPFQGNLISEEMQNQINKTAEAEAAYKKYAETISGLVAPAIDSFFAGIESGKDAFTALGDSIKALVIDLVKAIIKATILNAITGAIGGGAGAGIFGTITKLLGGGLGGVAAPSFGGGVSAGGFSLNGQVTFIQRGGDLVGVLNNSNKMINRVG